MSIQSHVDQIIAAIPTHTVVHVFSVGRDTETAREIETERTPQVDSDAAGNRLVLWRAAFRTKVHDDLEQLYRTRKDNETDTLSSCISTALRRSANVSSRTNRQVDVFIVSDMIEECGTSLLGGKVSLMKRDIEPEIRRATELGVQATDLRHATITLVRPQYNVITTKQSNQPSAADLERFWRELLAHCNTDSKQVFFGADLPAPEELFPPATTSSPASH